MAEKILLSTQMSTLILKVDLDCRRCYKKIRKILCKLQDQERIRTISYDGGSHTIAVAGPFDPHKLSCRIRCLGGKVIKGIDIIMHGHGGDGDGGGGCGGGSCRPEMMASPPLIKKGKKKKKGKPPKEIEPPPPGETPEHQPPQGEQPPPPATQPGHPPDSHIAAAMPVMKPRERLVELEPPPPPANDLYVPTAEPMEQEWPRGRLPPTPPLAAAKPDWAVDVTTTTTVEIPSWPAQPAAAGGSCGCSCCPPCYRGYYEGCRCCSCGRVYGYAIGVLPPPAGCYGAAGGYRPGCHQLLCEEDPASACTIM